MSGVYDHYMKDWSQAEVDAFADEVFGAYPSNSPPVTRGASRYKRRRDNPRLLPSPPKPSRVPVTNGTCPVGYSHLRNPATGEEWCELVPAGGWPGGPLRPAQPGGPISPLRPTQPVEATAEKLAQLSCIKKQIYLIEQTIAKLSGTRNFDESLEWLALQREILAQQFNDIR